MKTKEKQGITLIALVITIIILLILAGVSIAVLIGDNGTITKAVESKFKTELAEAREEFEIYVTTKYAENSKFEEGTLNAGKGFLTYNTMPEGETGNIYDVLKNTPKKYTKCFEIIKGELIYANTNKQQLEWALELGMKINPYLIDEEGTLLSSNTNLMLMDENTGTVVLPESVKKIADGAFRDVPGIRTIIIPGTVKEIGNYAFSGNPTLENVVMEEGVKKVGSYAFQDCIALKSVKISNSVEEIGRDTFVRCQQLTEINIPTSLNAIPIRMLASCSKLQEIIISDGPKIIDWYAFENCSNLQRVEISSTIENISGNAFDGIPVTANIEISPKNINYSFENNLLVLKKEKRLEYVVPNSNEINIPDTVEVIGTGVFENYPQNAIINISKNVKKIDTGFSNKITNITVDAENEYFKSIDGNLYDKSITTLYRYTKNEASFVLPSTVKTIEANAVKTANNLSQLTLPEGLEKIKGGYAFLGTKISKLYIPEKVSSIELSAWAGKDIEVMISSNNNTYKTEDGIVILSKDGKKIISVTKDLESYNIPNSVEIIGKSCFYARSIKRIELSSNVKIIENSAFDYAGALQKIEIPASVESIGTNAFNQCRQLKEIIIHKSKLPDGSDPISGAPWGCPNTREVVKWDN